MKHRIQIVALPVLTLCAVAASAETRVTCATGCIPTPACKGDASPNLLCLADRRSDVTLEWHIDRKLEKNEALRVYAGNPLAETSIPERQVEFVQQADALTGRYTLSSDQLGKGPLLVVTTLAQGKKESLLSWIPFRTATPAETQVRLTDAPPASEWAVDIVPSFIQVSAGARELPRTQDATTLTWYSLAGMQRPITDVDLDGPTTGAPGLGIQAAQAWHARDDWRSEILQRLQLPSKHSVEVDQLKWDEMPDRTAQIPGVGTVSLRNYYTVVTLFTNATVTNYSDKDLGRSGSKRYFAHETSAMLNPPSHPLLWASYTQSDYGSDRGLLDLLRQEVAASSGQLNLGPLQQISGDGGPPVYRVAFTVRARPWQDETTTGMRNPIAGIVGMDIVALRTGVGEVRIPAGKDTTGVTLDDCGVWKCEPGTALVNFHDPPSHTDIESWQVSAATPTGQAPMIREIGSIGQRGPDAGEPSIPERFPPLARFAVGANLRAGALLQRSGWFDHRVDNVIPINTYAQFVVRIAVVTFPNIELTTTDTVIHTSPKDLEVAIGPTIKNSFSKLIRDWIRDHFGLSMTLLGLLAVGVLILLCVLIPGCQLLAAIVGFFTALINRISQWLRPKR